MTLAIDLSGIGGYWPIGARLRFKLNGDLQPKYRHLRGTNVSVLGGPHLVPPTDGHKTWGTCQWVYSEGLGREGWCRLHLLEPRPDDPSPPSMTQLGEETIRRLPALA